MTHYNAAYGEQIMRHLQWQAEQIRRLTEEQTRLKEQLAELRSQRAIRVDRIEYRFDQLKIETLEGALHIGLSPEAGQSIEDLAVAEREIDTAASGEDERFRAIRQSVDRYLASGCMLELQQLERDHQLILGDAYKAEMLNDIRSQIDSRIRHYMREAAPEPQTEQHIADKVKRDVRLAMERHVSQKKRGEKP